MKLAAQWWLTMLASLWLDGCQNGSEAPPPVVEAVKEMHGETFTMAALRSGAVFAYNPRIYDNVLTTRYSDPVAELVGAVVSKMPSSCVFTGFAASVEGRLVRSGEEKALRLEIENVSAVRPLSESERQVLRQVSPTIRRETICDGQPLS